MSLVGWMVYPAALTKHYEVSQKAWNAPFIGNSEQFRKLGYENAPIEPDPTIGICDECGSTKEIYRGGYCKKCWVDCHD